MRADTDIDDRNADERVEPAHPMFSVTDFAAAVEYYRTALGFFVEWVRLGEDGSGIANLWRGKLSLFLKSRPQHGDYGRAGIYCHLKDQGAVDGLHSDFVANGANITEPPSARSWGLYEMRLVDLDGNEIRFACSLHEDGI